MVDSQKCSLPSRSSYMWPVHFGSQKYTAAMMEYTAPGTST